jgi:filamentous hemagglutinin family protein
MKTHPLCLKLLTACSLFIGGAFLPLSVQAQLIPDTTLGTESSGITPLDLLNDRIDGGAIRGANLFHSFLEFNVGNGRSVYFANPTGIENILTRVTGSNASNILGTLGVLGTANLFLINPNGIYFGPNARLEVSGSFLATTADGIQLGTQGYFSATDPQNSQLLSVQPGALFSNALRNWTAQINNRANLTVGGDLTFVADELDLQGQLQAGGNLTLRAIDSLQIRDSATHPFIAAAGRNLLIQGERSVDIFALNHPQSGLYSGGDLVLRSANSVVGDAHYYSGGNFRIEQLNGSLGKLLSPNDPVIRSLGNVSFDAYIGNSLHIIAAGQINIGQILITDADPTNGLVETVTLSDGTALPIDGRTQPTLDLRAGVDPAVVSGAVFNANDFFPFNFDNFLFNPNAGDPPTFSPPTSADITLDLIGIINVSNAQIFLSNQYFPNRTLPGGDIRINGFSGIGIATVTAAGNAGSVVIDARGNIDLTGGSIQAFTPNGNGGNVTLLANGNVAIATIDTAGDRGGNIKIVSNGTFSTVDNSLIASVTNSTNPLVQGGDIEINAQTVNLRNGSSIFSSTLGAAKGSNITINAPTIDLNNNATIVATTLGAAPGGNIEIHTGTINLNNGASIVATTPGAAQGGNVTVNAMDAVNLVGVSQVGDRAGLFTRSLPGSTGNAGSLTINTRQLNVRDGATVRSATGGAGNAGNLTINAAESIAVFGEGTGGRNSNISAQASNGSTGNAGTLSINTQQLILHDGAQIDSSTFGDGKGGNLFITATDSVEIVGTSSNGTVASNLASNAVGNGDAGDIAQINTRRLTVRDGAQVGIGTFGAGNGGTLEVNATDSIVVSGRGAVAESGLFSQTNSAATGNAGNLNLNAGQLIVRDRARVAADTLGTGNAGNLTANVRQLSIQNAGRISANTDGSGSGGNIAINASESVELSGRSNLFAQALAGTGNAGELTINTRRVLVQDGSQIGVATFSDGNSGNLTVNASEFIDVTGTSPDGTLVSGLFAGANPGSTGDAGNLTLNARRVLVRDGAQIGAGTSSAGNGGTLSVNAGESVIVSGSGTFAPSALLVSTEATGNAGDLNIQTGQLEVRDGARINAGTSSAGNGGRLNINASKSVIVSGSGTFGASGLSARATATGDAGELNLRAGQLLVQNGASVSASTSGSGNAGNLNLAAGQLLVQDSARVSAATSGAGNAGELNLRAGQLLVQNGASVSASTSGSGNAGNLNLETGQLWVQDGARVSAATSGTGNAGNLKITTRQLTIQTGGQIAANTTSTGRAGTLNVDATESVEVTGTATDPSRLFFDSTSSGDAGELTINTRRLVVSNGGQLSAATSGAGRGGILELNASDSIAISGAGGVFFDSRSAGNARGIRMNTGSLVVENGAQVTVSGSGTGRSGDLEVNANSVFLNNQGRLRSTTAASEGGNLKLQIANSVILRDNSEISAEAFGRANGGNITFEVGGIIFAILSENSDVVANAFEGNGGQITGRATGVFGFRQFEKVRTPESDFIASSALGFDGIVDIDEEKRQLPQLPADFLDVEDLNRDVCALRNGKIAGGSSFVITGRGGLPPNPLEEFTPLDGVVEWAAREDLGRGELSQPSLAENDNLSPKPAPISEEAEENEHPKEIRPVQGWIIAPDGTVILTAEVPTAAAYRSEVDRPSCRVLR